MKTDLNNKVIKVLTTSHGKEVLDFYKKSGVDTGGIPRVK